jgi:hypothetical protein
MPAVKNRIDFLSRDVLIVAFKITPSTRGRQTNEHSIQLTNKLIKTPIKEKFVREVTWLACATSQKTFW